jgi:hypothetical protein
MTYLSPGNLPLTRLSWLGAQPRMPALLRRWMPIVVAALFSRPLVYVLMALQAWLSGATVAMEAFVLRR